jgi:YggT family protein
LNIYLFSILIVVILSWVNPYPNALSQLLSRLTQPLLAPVRRRLPVAGGIDFSPMVVMLAIALIQMALPYLEHEALSLFR